MINELEYSFIIHSRSYSETSIIFDILTMHNGMISVIAKGAKRKKDISLLQPFKGLIINFSKKGNLPLLTKYEVHKPYPVVKKNFLLLGLYYNELLLRFMPKQEPSINIYNLYKNHLDYMSRTDDSNDAISLKFEILFLQEIGYKVNIAEVHSKNIMSKAKFYYDHEVGFRPIRSKNEEPFSIDGDSINYLLQNKFNQIHDIKKIRLIVRNLINELLGKYDIKSYDLFD